jgi:hypothetical protein
VNTLPDDLAETALLPAFFDGEIEALLVDHEISPSQARNLEFGSLVMDRTMVILEIFHSIVGWAKPCAAQQIPRHKSPLNGRILVTPTGPICR